MLMYVLGMKDAMPEVDSGLKDGSISTAWDHATCLAKHIGHDLTALLYNYAVLTNLKMKQ